MMVRPDVGGRYTGRRRELYLLYSGRGHDDEVEFFSNIIMNRRVSFDDPSHKRMAVGLELADASLNLPGAHKRGAVCNPGVFYPRI